MAKRRRGRDWRCIARPDPWALPFWLGSYAAVQRQGPENAIAAIREGLAEIEATGEQWFEAELYRLRGVAVRFASFSNCGQIEDDFHTAIRIAAEQGAKLLELRSATTLAQLWGEQGRRGEARELLAPVYGWFTEGFDAQDLKDAKALLDALS